MTTQDIAWQRFYQQGLLAHKFDAAVDVVSAIGAVQAQDYAGAKWAVAQRVRGLVSDAEMDEVYNRGDLLRTHVLRPTWHFVTPADIRWMLKLTAPRVHQANAYYYRARELDDAVFRRSHAAIIAALEGGNYCTRDELAAALQRVGITGDGVRIGTIVMHAELEGLICSGPRQGKQFTYALLEERVPPASEIGHDEALAELAKRYFTSHGPALLRDFVWWSGLTVTEAKQAITLAGAALEHETMNGQSYWGATIHPPVAWDSPTVHLLPNYDEALASFKDYSASMDDQFQADWVARMATFPHFLVFNGRIAGTWKRTLTARAVEIKTKPFRLFTPDERQALIAAASRYGDFLGLTVKGELATDANVG